MDALTTLSQLGSGKFLDKVAAQLAAVSQEVVRTGNAGSVSATLKVEPVKDSPMVVVTAVVQAKPPAEKPLGAMFYAWEDALYRDDPRQTRMDFTVVDTETGEIKKVGEDGLIVKEVN